MLPTPAIAPAIACVVETGVPIYVESSTLAAAPVSAQLFGGIVYDPTNYANAVLRYQQLQQQLSQLITTYQQIRTQYQLLLKQSQRLPFDLTPRYLGLRTPWRPLVGATTYGTTTPWLDAANTGHDALAAFTRATERLTGYSPALRDRAPAESLRIQDRVDRTQLQDGAVTTALEAIGRLRFHEGSVETTLRNLESDTYSNNADLHTQVAVLNRDARGSSAGDRVEVEEIGQPDVLRRCDRAKRDVRRSIDFQRIRAGAEDDRFAGV